MATIQGVVSAVDTRMVNTKFGLKPSYSVTVNGERYAAGFRAPSAAVGDFVDLTYDDSSRYKDIQSISKATGSPPAVAAKPPVTAAAPVKSGYDRVFPVPALSPERAIIRQNALGHATKVVLDGPMEVGSEDGVEEIIRIARKFEAYATGDLDKAMAEEDIIRDKVANAALPKD